MPFFLDVICQEGACDKKIYGWPQIAQAPTYHWTLKPKVIETQTKSCTALETELLEL